jgi:hypothetical protein
MRRAPLIALAAVALGAATVQAGTSSPGMTKCTMTFNLKGWSAVYKTATGTGRITCANGETADVTIDVKGGGLTFGKTEIVKGKGTFSEVKGIAETLGAYVAAEAHVGAVKAAQAAVYTKGEVSLAVTGKGRGVDIGIDFGELKIAKVVK